MLSGSEMARVDANAAALGVPRKQLMESSGNAAARAVRAVADPDGRVEAVFEGPDGAVDEMVEFCHTGSPAASVEGVEVEYGDPHGLVGFEIRR